MSQEAEVSQRINALKRDLVGSWTFNLDDETSVFIELGRSASCTMSIATQSVGQRVATLVTGAVYSGKWRVARQPAKSLLDSSADSVGRLRSSLPSSVSSADPAAALEHQRSEQEWAFVDGQPPLCYLVFEFSKLPESPGNILAFGFRVEAANMLMAMVELFRKRNYAILDFEKAPERRLTLRTPDGADAVWVQATAPIRPAAAPS